MGKMFTPCSLAYLNDLAKFGSVDEFGENTEIRTYDLDGDQCHVVIGLIEELPMEKELKEMKIKN